LVDKKKKGGRRPRAAPLYIFLFNLIN